MGRDAAMDIVLSRSCASDTHAADLRTGSAREHTPHSTFPRRHKGRSRTGHQRMRPRPLLPPRRTAGEPADGGGSTRGACPGRSSGRDRGAQRHRVLASGATLDRFAADQIIPFAALASGQSRFIIPAATDHVLTSAWLAEEFLDARVDIDGQQLTINGVGFWPDRDRTAG